jgi:type IV secretory pathway VirB2 component (pilin)
MKSSILVRFLSKIKNNMQRFSAVLLAWGVASLSYAGTSEGGGMPWEGPLQKIQASIAGPVAMTLGVIVIVIAGLGIAFGEGGSGVRKMLQVVFGLAIAFTASSIIVSLFGSAAGALF